MLEQQRIEYLQAMGIQLWMPREALPNAAESLWLTSDITEQGASGHSQTAGASVQAGHAADLLAGMGLDTPKPVAVAEKTATQPQTTNPSASSETPSTSPANGQSTAAAPSATAQLVAADAIPTSDLATATENIDFTVPRFELYFALWPCGMLWVSGRAFEQKDHAFQTAVSYALLGNTIPQANYSQFKWPYIEGSNEDQSMAVALRALTAQWEFMSGQGARGWISMDDTSYEWLNKVASKPLYSVESADELFTMVGKKQLWQALQTLPSMTAS